MVGVVGEAGLDVVPGVVVAGGVTGEVLTGGLGLVVGCVDIRPEYWKAA